MVRIDPTTQFWLRYVESAGGMWEPEADCAFVMLPPSIRAAHDLPEELRVTTDPDVSREDGATLLAPGHPLLTGAAEQVLAVGDVGAIRLERPTTPAPDTAKLLDVARDQFPVDHGRIDASDGVSPATRPILRVGALVTYEVSTDEHYQERAECWVDVSSRLSLPEPVVGRLAQLVRQPRAAAGGALPTPESLGAALHHADEQLDAQAHGRRTILSRQARESYSRELERTAAYYDEALASLRRRMSTAPSDRVAAYEARVESTRAERERRIAEVEEKYRPHHVIRPFRLHLIEVPVLRLPVDVRRGERRYPLTLDWLHPAGTFAGIRCAHCDSPAPLVASKTRLGCESCLGARTSGARAAAPAKVADASAATARKASGSDHSPPAPSKAPQPTSAPRRPHAPKPAKTSVAVSPSPAAIRKAGGKLVRSLWTMVAASDRRLRRSYAPSSPAQTLHGLFGAAGPLYLLGVPSGTTLESYDASESEPVDGDPSRFVVSGHVETSTGTFEYGLCWRLGGGTALIEEILPTRVFGWPRMARPLPWQHQSTSSQQLPDPTGGLDPVGRAVWERVLPRHGLALALRILTAWARIPDGEQLAERHGRSAVAAALDRMVTYRSGLPGGGYADVGGLYRVADPVVRAANGELQRRLKLSATQVW